MKKIISLVLCLTLVFSIASISLTANAWDVAKIYSFNDDTFIVEVHLDKASGRSKGFGCITFMRRPEGKPYNPKYVTEYGEGDLQYIMESFLPERVSDYEFSIIQNALFDCCNETEVAYIISKLDSHIRSIECYRTSYDTIEPTTVITDMSPIVDAMLESSFKNTLEVFYIRDYTNITEIDDRLFTEFPKLGREPGFITIVGCNIFSYDENAGVTIDEYKSPCCYVVVSPEEEINTLYGEYKYDCATYLYDYYYNNIYQYLDGPDNLSVKIDKYGTEIQVFHYYDCNGMEARVGRGLYVRIVFQGDATGDGFTDSFDVAMTTEYVNNFEEPEDEAVKLAMDVVADGYIDATDLAYISYIANFEG